MRRDGDFPFTLDDDALFFCNVSSDEMYLRLTPFWFEAISRLRTNSKKSGLILMGGLPNIEELKN